MAYAEDPLEADTPHRPHRRPRLVPLTIAFLEDEVTHVIRTNVDDEMAFDEADTLMTTV